MLIEAPKNFLRKNFAKDSTAQVDCLMVGCNRLFVDEVRSVDHKTIHCNEGKLEPEGS